MIKIDDRVLSPTAINTYLACPRKFYLKYIERHKTKPSIYLIRGQIVHQTLHKFHKTHPQISRSTPLATIRRELFAGFNGLWDKAAGSLSALQLTDAQIQFFHDDSELMLLNFSHWFYKNDMPSPDLTEARIFSQKLRLLGIIDAVHESPEKVILVDYKTSKHPRITQDITRQAALYALLYQDRFKVTPEAVWVHFLIEPGDPLPVHVDEELLGYGEILIKSIREKTATNDINSYPCTCGGYCEMDLLKPKDGANR